MNLLKRIKNLWQLSEVEVSITGDKLKIGTIITTIEKPRMAQIIRRKDVVKEVLKNDN